MAILLPDPAYLNDLMQGIVTTLHEDLSEHSPLADKMLTPFVSFTRPPDDCCNTLAIWLEVILATDDFPNQAQAAAQCGTTGSMARLGIKLVRDCWPVVKDSQTDPFPDPVGEIQPASESLLIDARIVWCSLMVGMQNGSMRPESSDDECTGLQIESLIPDAPRGGCAGFTANILVELPSCC